MMEFGSFSLPSWEQLGSSNKSAKMGCVSEGIKKLNNSGKKSAYDFASSNYINSIHISCPPPAPQILKFVVHHSE